MFSPRISSCIPHPSSLIPSAVRLSACRLVSLLTVCLLLSCQDSSTVAREIVRPEKIRSWREVYYDKDTYVKLAALWKDYYNAYPSEDAYANWMYASRYAQAEDYEKLLDKGLKKYPANPTLLYLAAMKSPHDVNWAETRRYLERAAELDPSYNDPWFMLAVNYLQEGNEERHNEALRHLLENNAVSEEVMDYSYNTLAALDSNAILITNGDNDTYPAWILSRVVGHRPDVIIANRSLLNTDWYPLRIIEHGAPPFITSDEITAIHAHAKPPWSDTLIVRLIGAAVRAKRPVYFALTLESVPALEPYREKGRMFGLATLVTPPVKSDADMRQAWLNVWLRGFRTSGLDSWQLRHAKRGHAGKMLMPNYAAVLTQQIEPLRQSSPELLPPLFQWYCEHVEPLLSTDMSTQINSVWCGAVNDPAGQEWCRRKGL